MTDEPRPLSPLLLGHLGEPGRSGLAELPGLEARLQELLTTARAAWPGIELSPEAFMAYVAERLPAGESPEERLAIDAGELYLVCACSRGDQTALRALEQEYFPVIDAAVAHMGLAPADLDEVKQTLRCRLLVAASPARPKIEDYAGRGDLRGLLRVAGVRAAISLLRPRARESDSPDDDLLGLPAAEPDPELQHLRHQHAAEFKRAFQEAVGRLSSRERNILRMHVLDRVTVEQIGGFYGVHRATATRWLARARTSILSEMRRILRARLRLGATELETLVRAIHSRLDLSLSRVFARGEKTGR